MSRANSNRLQKIQPTVDTLAAPYFSSTSSSSSGRSASQTRYAHRQQQEQQQQQQQSLSTSPFSDLREEDEMSQSSDISSTATITPADRHEVLYFAYGSNLSTRQMLDRCPSSVAVCLGYLPGWRWIINERGYANIVRVGGSADDHSSPAKGKAPAAAAPATPLRDAAAQMEYDRQPDKGKGKEVERPDDENDKGDNDGDDVDEMDVQSVNTGVYGLLYLVPPQDEACLDGYEGVPKAYQKERVEVEMVPASQEQQNTGQHQHRPDQPVRVQVVNSLVYVDNYRVVESEPLDEYIGRMNTGIREAVDVWGMPHWYVDGVMRRFIPDDDDDEEEEEDDDVVM